MAPLSYVQVAKYAEQAGFSAKDGTSGIIGFSEAAVATGLAWLESRLDPAAINSTPCSSSHPEWGHATGLWQICPSYDNKKYLDPAKNAAAAYIKYRGGGWNPWNTDVSAADRLVDPNTLIATQNMLDADAAVRVAHGKPPRDPGAVTPGVNFPNPLHGLSSLADLVGWITNGSNWLRVLMVIGGAALVGLALYMLVIKQAVPSVAKVLT